MKKFGYTLAEVLITMGLIGFVAALTAPALIKNTGSAKIGPSLSNFVNTFENAVQKMMLDENVESMSGRVAPTMVLLSKYMEMVPLENTDTYTFKDAKGQTSYARPDGNSTWKLKNGTLMEVLPLNNFVAIENRGIYKGIVAEVIVDIDGEQGYNRAGKDVFAFLLDDSGALIPAGSKAHRYIGQSGETYVKAFDSNCALDNSLSHNFACTGAMADKDWKYDKAVE